MNTKFDINEKVKICGEVQNIHVYGDGNIRYSIDISGNSLTFKESELEKSGQETQNKVDSLIDICDPTMPMALNEYQYLAARTINPELNNDNMAMHALHGMVGEIGEIHSLYQKFYQGHPIDYYHLKKEIGDLMWFIAELCTAHDWNLNDICEMNIDKLIERYPEGFTTEKSINRKDGDI